MQGPEDSPFVEQHTTYSGAEPYVDGPFALQTFEEWLDTHKQDLPPFDQASLFIGYILTLHVFFGGFLTCISRFSTKFAIQLII